MRLPFGSVALVAVALMVLIPAPGRAELRQAEFKLPGMDCAYCNGAMSTAIKKLDGVESVELDAARGAAVIRLKADNKITLQQLRRVIKSVGYEAKGADITARGRIAAGGLTFDLLNGSSLTLADGPHEASTAIVEITGVAKPDEKDVERLTIAAIRAPAAR
jgi:copper chaperone CopZ